MFLYFAGLFTGFFLSQRYAIWMQSAPEDHDKSVTHRESLSTFRKKKPQDKGDDQ